MRPTYTADPSDKDPAKRAAKGHLPPPHDVDLVEEAGEESFPASDSPSFNSDRRADRPEAPANEPGRH